MRMTLLALVATLSLIVVGCGDGTTGTAGSGGSGGTGGSGGSGGTGGTGGGDDRVGPGLVVGGGCRVPSGGRSSPWGMVMLLGAALALVRRLGQPPCGGSWEGT